MFLSDLHLFSFNSVMTIYVVCVCNGSSTTGVEEYLQLFTHHRHLNKNVFIRVFNKLCETGTLPSADITSERATRQGLEEVENILDLVGEDPTTSSRRIAIQLEIPQRRIINTPRARLIPIPCTESATPTTVRLC